MVFEVVVHVGTLLAVFVVFWEEILVLIKSFQAPLKAQPSAGAFYRSRRRCAGSGLCHSTSGRVCTAFKDRIEALLSPLVGFMLMITGTILFVTDRLQVRQKNLEEITVADALMIGVGQSIAVLPEFPV